MDSKTLSFLLTLIEALNRENWKKALDALILPLRLEFIFDNMAIYIAEEQGNIPEVAYARAVGRGRSAEADVSWGENIANQVIATGKLAQEVPPADPSLDRIKRPYVLGLPLSFIKGHGALIFVRFGGPEYLPDQIMLAVLVAGWVTCVFERRFVQEKNIQLETARNRSQLQDDFIATISHDLRTPIGFIKGYTTSLLRSDTTWNIVTQREFLNIIDEETDHLTSLIDRLLDSARLQSGKLEMDFQPLQLESLLRDITMRVCGRNKTLDVELNIEPAPPIQADTVRLAQVFENLFDNAIKYAPDSKVTISMRQSDDHVTITFADRGPGISPEHLPFLFERFYGVPNQNNRRGTGLGLFICKQIVQAHHGSISVDTALGKGTVFCIDLPVKQE